MSDESIFNRQSGESDAQYILRLYMDPWFEDSTPKELADFIGLPSAKVSRVLFAWVKSSKVRRIHSHATDVAEQMGWAGTPEGLIHTALELMKQRADQREKKHVTVVGVDGEIEELLMDVWTPPKTVLPADTDPGN